MFSATEVTEMPSILAVKGHIHLVEDDEILRSDLTTFFSQSGFSIESYVDAEDFISRAVEVAPAVIVADIVLPGRSGIDLVKIVRDIGWHAPVIYISGYSEPHQIIEAMKSGAADFLWKPLSIDTLISSVSLALQQEQERVESNKKLLQVKELYQKLTEREQQICQLAVSGNGNLEIGKLLSIQPDTVKKHRSRVMEKMRVSNLAELIECYQYLDRQN